MQANDPNQLIRMNKKLQSLNTEEVLKKLYDILSSNAEIPKELSFKDFESFLMKDFNYSSLKNSARNEIQELIRLILKENFQNKISVFVPGKQFQSMSVTGDVCELHCEHCDRKYLQIMRDISSEEKLKSSLEYLVKNKYQGCLFSGGCTSDGKVPVFKYADTLREYKKKTDLIFNFHTGLLNEKEIESLASIPPDAVSFDLTMDQQIITDVYHLDSATPQDYITTYNYFLKYNLNVIPHITLGLYFGKFRKEKEALQFLYELNPQPKLIVFIILIPPKENPKFKLPNIDEIRNIFVLARLLFPESEISMGCMRPRGKMYRDIEQAVVEAGLNRIVIPMRETQKILEDRGMKLDRYEMCCAIPLNLYKRK